MIDHATSILSISLTAVRSRARRDFRLIVHCAFRRPIIACNKPIDSFAKSLSFSVWQCVGRKRGRRMYKARETDKDSRQLTACKHLPRTAKFPWVPPLQPASSSCRHRLLLLYSWFPTRSSTAAVAAAAVTPIRGPLKKKSIDTQTLHRLLCTRSLTLTAITCLAVVFQMADGLAPSTHQRPSQRTRLTDHRL